MGSKLILLVEMGTLTILILGTSVNQATRIYLVALNSPSGYAILLRKLHRPRHAILACNIPVNRTSLAPPQGGERLRKEALISR